MPTTLHKAIDRNCAKAKNLVKEVTKLNRFLPLYSQFATWLMAHVSLDVDVMVI